MKRETRCALTLLPTLMGACFIAMQGWVSFPLARPVRWFGAFWAVYFIWLWVDWLEREGRDSLRLAERRGYDRAAVIALDYTIESEKEQLKLDLQYERDRSQQ